MDDLTLYTLLKGVILNYEVTKIKASSPEKPPLSIKSVQPTFRQSALLKKKSHDKIPFEIKEKEPASNKLNESERNSYIITIKKIENWIISFLKNVLGTFYDFKISPKKIIVMVVIGFVVYLALFSYQGRDGLTLYQEFVLNDSAKLAVSDSVLSLRERQRSYERLIDSLESKYDSLELRQGRLKRLVDTKKYITQKINRQVNKTYFFLEKNNISASFENFKLLSFLIKSEILYELNLVEKNLANSPKSPDELVENFKYLTQIIKFLNDFPKNRKNNTSYSVQFTQLYNLSLKNSKAVENDMEKEIREHKKEDKLLTEKMQKLESKVNYEKAVFDSLYGYW